MRAAWIAIALMVTTLACIQANDTTASSSSNTTSSSTPAAKTPIALSSKPKAPTTAVTPANQEPPAPPPVPENLRDNPSYDIPFPQPASGFKPNPSTLPIKMGPTPDVLKPSGSSAPATLPDKEDDSNVKPLVNVDLPARNVVDIPQATVKEPSANTPQETVTSPFLDWIQKTKNAAEIAKAQRDAYEQAEIKEKMSKEGTDQDLFLHIRFPYLGNQDLPPGGGEVIYSMPQR